MNKIIFIFICLLAYFPIDARNISEQSARKFHKWVEKALQDGHITKGNATWLHRKFEEHFNKNQSFQASKNGFITWVHKARSDGNLTDGNVNYIVRKINQLKPAKKQSTLPNPAFIQQLAAKCNFIHFYLEGSTSFFGNFFSGNIIHYNGLAADNVEALFQAQKFVGTPEYHEFNNIDAEHAFTLKKKLEKKYSAPANWHNGEKDRVMKELLVLKFSDNTYQDILLATGNAYLVEHNNKKGRDDYWSDDNDGTGQNKLGIYLMELRGKLGGTGVVGRPNEYDYALQQNHFPVF